MLQQNSLGVCIKSRMFYARASSASFIHQNNEKSSLAKANRTIRTCMWDTKTARKLTHVEVNQNAVDITDQHLQTSSSIVQDTGIRTH